MKMSSWKIEFSSLRELYDSIVQIEKSVGKTDTISWEVIKEQTQPLLKSTPTEYRHLDVRISNSGKIIESYKENRKEINLTPKG